MKTSAPKPRPERLQRAEASAWLAKLHGPERSAELEADFRAWLAASPRNAASFEQLTEVWDSLGSVDMGGMPRLAAAGERTSRRAPRLLKLAAACSVAMLVGIALYVLRGISYSTDIGEQRVVTLADGSRLSLNSGTQADIEFDQRRRVVRLVRGEAYFEVARNVDRPFVVDAGHRTITAVGTAFVVRRDEDSVTVTLTEGKVIVTSGDESTRAAPAAAVQLQPGERIKVRGAQQKIDTLPPQAIAAWRRGEVELDYTPLREAIDEMNRYDRKRLVLDDAALGELPVSGIYRISDNQGFAEAIAVVYGLTVTEQHGALYLRRQ